MARTHRQLHPDQRRALFRLVEARMPVGEIGTRLGRHPSTIYRKLGRNSFRDGDRGFCGYFPLTAQDLARRHRQRHRKLAADDGLREYVAERLREAGRRSIQDGSAPPQPGTIHPVGFDAKGDITGSGTFVWYIWKDGQYIPTELVS